MKVKAYSKSLMPKRKDLGFERVMLWQRYNGHTNPKLRDDVEGHALKAYKAINAWDRWMRDADNSRKSKTAQQWGYEDCLKDLYAPEELAGMSFDEKVRRGVSLKTFCRTIGLRPSEPSNWNEHILALSRALTDALMVHQGIRQRRAGAGPD